MRDGREEFAGGCYCTGLRYRCFGPVGFKAQCHCRECQYFSGGGVNFFMLVPEAGFAWTAGRPQAFTRGDLEDPVTRCFCGICGIHILTRLPGRDHVVLKIGTLDNPARFKAPRAAIHTLDAQPFHHIPDGIPAFERLPPR